jgi:hypothetical protein
VCSSDLFIADDPDIVEAQLVAFHASQLVGSPTNLPGSVSWRPYVRTIPDQGPTSSCVGQAFATAIETRSHVAGSPIDRPSAKAIYDIARMIGTGRTAPLFDGGSSPTDAMNGMREYGLVSERRWPFSIDAINVKPSLDIFHAGCDALLGQHYRIASGGGAANMLRQALAKGFIPCFAMSVDDAFMAWGDSAVYSAPLGPSVGWHMQAIVGYSDDFFEVAGSWGGSWADGGFVRIAASFIESSSLVHSILVPTVLPISVH